MDLPIDYKNTEKELSGTFVLSYYGPATKNKTIEASSYAKSLLGFSRSISRLSQKILDANIKIEVREERGKCWKSFSDFVLSNDVITIKNIAEWLIILAIPARHYNKVPIAILDIILSILKKAKGKLKNIKNEIHKLNIPDLLKEQLFKLMQDSELRESIDQMSEILSTEGIETVDIEQENYIKHRLIKTDRPSLISQPEDEIEEEFLERDVSIIYISPDRTNWKFKDNRTEYWAQVTDSTFLEKMKDKRIDDISGDHYIATLHVINTKEAGTKRTKIERYIYGFRKTQFEGLQLFS